MVFLTTKNIINYKKQKFYCKLCSKYFQFFFLFILLVLNKINCGNAQCPQLEPPCRCAPSIYEPIAIICENARSLTNALNAIENAKTLLVFFYNILNIKIFKHFKN